MIETNIQCVYANTLKSLVDTYHGHPMYLLLEDGMWYCINSGEEYTEEEFCTMAKELLERRCKHERVECDYYDGGKR